jgi:hypothetical protein
MNKKLELTVTKYSMMVLTGIFFLMSHFCELQAQTLRNCSEIKFYNPSAPSGVYSIDPDGAGAMPAMNCQCDMTTDGGGWTLVLNYNHLENTDPALKVFTDNFPLQGQTTLGIDESNTNYWGHAGTILMTAIPFDEVRFYGITSGHNRVMDFKTSHAATVSYFKTGNGSTEGISTNFTPLVSHTTYLPAAVNMTVSNMGDYAMTAYPLWNGSTYHWYLGGADPVCIRRWEVDDYPCNTPSTFHQIWVRQNEFLGIKSHRESGIELKLFPNPILSSAELTLTNVSPALFNQTDIIVFDIFGKQVFPDIERNEASFTIGKGLLSPGIYFCKLISNRRVLSVAKMVVN